MLIYTKFLKFLLAVIILFTLVITINCCHNGTNVNSLLISADTLMNIHPDSSLRIIKSINPDDIHSSSIRAKYSLLYSQALDKNYIDLTTDSIIRYAVDYYKKRGNSHQKAKTFYYLGRIYHNAKNTEYSIRMLYEAEEYALHTTDYYLCALIYSALGNLYYYQRSYPEAAEMFSNSADYFGKAGEMYKRANTLAYTGKAYSLKLEDSSAVKYYTKALEIYINLKDTTNILVINNEIATNNIKNIKLAESILKEGYTRYNNHKILLMDYPLWARIYLEKNNLAKAREYALLALDESFPIKGKKYGLYLILRNIELKDKNYKKAYEYSVLHSNHNATAFYEEKTQLIQEIKERYTKDKLQASYTVLQKAHKYQKIIYGLATALLLVTGVFIIIRQISKRKIMLEKFNREMMESNSYIENLREHFSNLENKYKTLASKSDKNNEHTNRFLKIFEQRLVGMKGIMDIAYTSEGKPIHFYNKFKEYINSSIKTEDAFGDLQYIVNEKYFGIINHVKKNYPTLTNADLDFFSMLCFGFSSNAIRLIYGHTNLDSIFTKRKKLREKFSLPPSIQIETFINNLKTELQKNNTI